MQRFDLILITTVEADNYKDACAYLEGLADGLADENHMPFTSEHPGMAMIDPVSGNRLFSLLPIAVGSKYEGPIEMMR